MSEDRSQTRNTARPKQAPTSRTTTSPITSTREQGGMSSGFMAFLVFAGSFVGTLIGTFASFNDMADSMERIQEVINPPAEVCVVGSSTILGDGLGMAAQW